MKLSDLDFSFPDELIATEPQRPSRVCFKQSAKPPVELSKKQLLQKLEPGDALVINQSKVVKRRVVAKGSISGRDFEVLFTDEFEDSIWQGLFPASRLKTGEDLIFPNEIRGQLIESSIPQKIKLNHKVDLHFFHQYGEVPLPPYIQKKRGEQRIQPEDESWYQTEWARVEGSSAAPTASLHFDNQDLDDLRARGVEVIPILLHVGLGTYLPVQSEDLDDHPMHAEWVEVLQEDWQRVQNAKRVWALGTTVVRALESVAAELIAPDQNGNFFGETRLLIQPGYSYQIVDVLLTNFHQPKTTLMALVAAFAGLEETKKTYEWAIENRFRLFSYGDLSVWL